MILRYIILAVIAVVVVVILPVCREGHSKACIGRGGKDDRSDRDREPGGRPGQLKIAAKEAEESEAEAQAKKTEEKRRRLSILIRISELF